MSKIKIVSSDRKQTKLVEPCVVKDYISLGWKVAKERMVVKDIKKEEVKKDK